MEWGMEEKQLLRRLWDEGHTAGQIAKLIGKDVTRNAVIGAAHRLNLPKRDKPILNKSKKFKKQTTELDKVENTNNEEPNSLNKTMLDIKNNECRYPHGDPKQSNFGLCGHPVKSGSSYCKFHHKLCKPHKATIDPYRLIPAYFKAS